MLCVENVSLAYGDERILSDITIPQVPRECIVGVLGANGAGKSTMLKALAGLIPYTGVVTANGDVLSGLSFGQRAAMVGYLPQTLPQATTLVAYESVVSACRAVRPDLPRPAVDRAVEDIFQRLDIRHLAFRAMSKMSGGQRQMVGLAQILVRRPRILLLDEPTSALDLKWQSMVFQVVRSFLDVEGGVCLMALHDINLAVQQCDRIALFGGGRLLAYDTPHKALTADTIKAAYDVAGKLEFSSEGTPFLALSLVRETQMAQ